MSLIRERVQKAIQRSQSQDLAAIREDAKGKQPVDLAGEAALTHPLWFACKPPWAAFHATMWDPHCCSGWPCWVPCAQKLKPPVRFPDASGWSPRQVESGGQRLQRVCKGVRRALPLRRGRRPQPASHRVVHATLASLTVLCPPPLLMHSSLQEGR